MFCFKYERGVVLEILWYYKRDSSDIAPNQAIYHEDEFYLDFCKVAT